MCQSLEAEETVTVIVLEAGPVSVLEPYFIHFLFKKKFFSITV